MRKAWGISGLLLIGLATMVGWAAPRLHAQQGPAQGYQFLADPQGGGGVLVSRRVGSGSATALLRQAFAEVETFAQNLPVLVNIWGSSRTADWVVQEAIDKALDSLREIGEIHRQVAANRDRTLQRIHDKWTEVIRGTRIIEDIDTGRRTDVNLGWSTEIVTTLNRHEGYTRYREIPLWELNQ